MRCPDLQGAIWLQDGDGVRSLGGCAARAHHLHPHILLWAKRRHADVQVTVLHRHTDTVNTAGACSACIVLHVHICHARPLTLPLDHLQSITVVTPLRCSAVVARDRRGQHAEWVHTQLLLWLFGSRCCRYHPQSEPQYTILKTPLSKKLAQDVQVFIHNFNSIPAFTANYTMTLFQQTTSGA